MRPVFPVVVVLSLVLGACAGAPAPSTAEVASPPLAPSPQPSPSPLTVASCDAAWGSIPPARPPDLPSLGITKAFDLPTGLDAFALGEAGGSLWVADALAGWVHRVDPGTGAALASIEVGPGGDMYFAPTSERLWLSLGEAGAALPIDLATNVTGAKARVGVRTFGIAAADGVLVATDFDAEKLVELDPSTGAVGRSVALNPRTDTLPEMGPTDVGLLGGDAWVLGHRGRVLMRVDLATFLVAEQVCVEVPNPERLLVTPEAIWVSSNKESTIARLDLVTRKVVARIRLPDLEWPGLNQAWEMSLDAKGRVWVAAGALAARIDPATNLVDAWVDLRTLSSDQAAGGAFDVRVVGDALWIAFSSPGGSKLVKVALED